MRVLVLGSGVIGVASAWYLIQAGHEVIVLDRRDGPARETSYANGGQISVSHAVPWANPGTPLQALRWLGKEESPLLWRLRVDMAQWAWGLRFLRECSRRRAEANTAAIVRLGLYSRTSLKALRSTLGLDYDQLERGILHVYSDAQGWHQALAQAEMMRRLGCEREERSRAECLEIEPALRHSRVELVGGTYTAQDESGDARRFTECLGDRCRVSGAEFRFGANVRGLINTGGAVTGVLLDDGETVTADAYVVALGSYTPLLLRPLGIRLPVYPAKGYSLTFPVNGADDQAPTVSLTDDGHRLVFSRLGQRLRVAGTAEFDGYNDSINEARCAAIERRARAWFPDLPESGVERWAGLRPATPGNVPLIGRLGPSNLYVNSGHGTLGWTLACGSGRLLADLMSGTEPEIAAAPYLPAI